jgi:hypothetical protein
MAYRNFSSIASWNNCTSATGLEAPDILGLGLRDEGSERVRLKDRMNKTQLRYKYQQSRRRWWLCRVQNCDDDGLWWKEDG